MMTESDGNNGLVAESTVEERLESLQAQLKNAADVLQRWAQVCAGMSLRMDELEIRLRRIENKTQGLSDRPPNRNCPNCHKRVTAASGTCGACGTRMLM